MDRKTLQGVIESSGIILGINIFMITLIILFRGDKKRYTLEDYINAAKAGNLSSLPQISDALGAGAFDFSDPNSSSRTQWLIECEKLSRGYPRQFALETGCNEEYPCEIPASFVSSSDLAREIVEYSEDNGQCHSVDRHMVHAFTDPIPASRELMDLIIDLIPNSSSEYANSGTITRRVLAHAANYSERRSSAASYTVHTLSIETSNKRHLVISVSPNSLDVFTDMSSDPYIYKSEDIQRFFDLISNLNWGEPLQEG
jgi:hypothetical protein